MKTNSQSAGCRNFGNRLSLEKRFLSRTNPNWIRDCNFFLSTENLTSRERHQPRAQLGSALIPVR